MGKPTQVKSYSQEDINSALDDIKIKKMSISHVAKEYNIPKSTLFCKYKNIIPIEAARSGPSTILSAEEELYILNWIFYCCDRGFPVNKDQLLDTVRKYIISQERENPFTNDRPGRHWYEAFCRRHPDLSKRMAQNLSKCRALATPERLKSWFNEVEEYLDSKNLKNIHPSRIINLDESGFSPCPKAGYVLAKKGTKSVHKVVGGNEKESITVLFTINAVGEMAPPMILFSYQRLPASIGRKIPEGWSVGNTENGWMTSESFYEYVTNVLYPWAIKKQLEFPIIVYLDGHSSHITLPLVSFCRDHKIELISLFPNATHVLQPLDVAFFRPLKASWKAILDQWRLDHGFELFEKENVAPLLKTAVDRLEIPEIMKHGFAKCGLSPFSSDAFDFKVLDGKKNKEPDGSEINSQLLENRYHLKYIEKLMPSSLVEEFKSGSLNDIRNDGLLKLWLKAKELSGQKVSYPPEISITNEQEVLIDNDVIVLPFENLATHQTETERIENIMDYKDSPVVDIESENSANEVDSVAMEVISLVDEDSRASMENIENVNSQNMNNSIVIEALSSSTSAIPQVETDIPNVPSAFKEHFFWPSKLTTSTKRKPKEKVPSVATSENWKLYFEKREQEKAHVEKEKQEKREKRKLAQDQKAADKIAVEQRKKARLDKKIQDKAREEQEREEKKAKRKAAQQKRTADQIAVQQRKKARLEKKNQQEITKSQ